MASLDQLVINISDYKITKSLCGGSAGVIYLGVRTSTGERVAIKYLRMPDCTAVEQAFIRELLILAEHRHPAILHLLGFTLFGGERGPVIILPYLPHDDLARMIGAERHGTALPGWTPTVKSKCVFGIAAGMSYLHSRRVIHRDLRPYNILFDENFEPVIQDFGLSRVVAESHPFLEEIPDPQFHIAPEAFDGLQDDGDVGYTFPVDVYSYGMLLYMMFSAHQIPKFTTGVSATTSYRCFNNVRNGIRYEKPAQVTAFYWELIQRCWAQDCKERPTFPEIIELLLDTHDYAFTGTDMRALVEYEEKITSFQSEP
jgi:serine/threonine protein kinase